MARLQHLGFLALTLLAGCSSLPAQPTISDRDATSCPGDILGIGSPAPTQRDIVAWWVSVDVGKTTTARACFYRDQVRPEDRAAIAWSIRDTDLATLTVSSGPTATIQGRVFGTTTITAMITGVAVTKTLYVCESTGRCPPY